MTGAVTLRQLDAVESMTRIQSLANVLIDCVEGGASVGFMQPMTMERAVAFWTTVAVQVRFGQRALVVAEEDGEVVGTVQLILSLPENQPHRADVSKMLVLRRARRRGFAAQLLQSIEETTRNLGKTLLVLDTVTGSDAERLYARSGWQRVGDIPDFALMPDGPLCSTTFFYKSL